MDYITRVDFLKADGSIIGSVNGLIMSYYDQSVIFTPFDINKEHFTHAKNAICVINDKIIDLNSSRLSHPFLLRIWNIPYNGINPSSELNINFPKKNHEIYGVSKINDIDYIDINFWHRILPPILAHQISDNVQVGTITQFNNKVTGIVVTKMFGKSIIINTYTLKQLISGLDFYYSNLFYHFGINKSRQIYVKEDWDQYDNCLQKGDILLTIENVIVDRTMHYEKFNKDLHIDTWLTYMFMEKDNNELNCAISRDSKIHNIKVPRKPLYEIMQIPYYSNDETMSFEKMHINTDIDRYNKFSKELYENPKKIFY
jgi:hypothetical protein